MLRLLAAALLLVAGSSPGWSATEVLRPSAAGNYQNWTPSTGTTHYTLVNDSSTATYLQFQGSSGLKETEQLADSALASGTTITSVVATVGTYSWGGTGPAETVQIVWRIGSTDYLSAAVTADRTGFVDVTDTKATNPATGLAWTVADVNGLEIGIVCAALGASEYMRVSEFSITVNYTLPPGAWDGGGGADTNWSTAANWSNDTLPGESDVVTFSNAYSNNSCAIDASAVTRVKGVAIIGSYSGTITQAAGRPVYLGSSGFSMSSASATWSCSDTLYTPSFVQTAGTFSGTGTVYLRSKTSAALSASSALNNLTIEGIDSGLMGYWKMDSASTVSEPDSSDLGHTATLVNGPASTTATKATLSFDNRAARTCNTPGLKYLSAAGSTDFSPAGAFSVATWCHVGETGSQNYLMRYGDISTNGWLLAIGTNPNYVARFAVYGGAGTTTSSGPNLTVLTPTWYHLAGVYDGLNTYIYVNGVAYARVARTTGMTAPAAGSNSLYLGGDGGTNTCLGEVDDMRIYNRALSEGEVKNLYAGNHGDATYAATFTMGSAVTVNGNLTIWSGTLADGGNTLTVKGSLALYGKLSGTGTVALTGTTAGQTLRSGEARFNHLTVNSAGAGAWTLQDELNVGGTLTISGGTLATGNNTVRCGSLSHTAGTFTLGTSKLVIDNQAGGSVATALTLPELRIEDPSETNLAGCWKFDLQSGLTDRDWSGNGNTAYFRGATHTATKPAAPLFADGGSAVFDGARNAVTVANSASLSPTAAVTVAAWIYPTGRDGTYRHLMVKQRSNDWTSPFACYAMRLNTANKLEGWINDGAVYDSAHFALGNTAGITANTAWHHCAFTFDGRYMRVYLDGVIDGVGDWGSTVALATSTQDLAIGGIPSEPTNVYNFQGYIDDARVYDRALTDAEIRNLANGRYVNGASGTATTTLAANLAATSLGVDSGTFDANGFATTVTNPFTLQQGQGAYACGSGTQTFSGGLTVSGGTFTGGSGTVAVTGAFTQVATIDPNGNAAQSGGAFTAPSGTMTITTNFVRASPGAGTFAANGGTVQFTGAGAGNTITSGGCSFANLQVTGAGAWSVVDALTATGTMTVSNGTLTQNPGAAITAGGWSQSAGAFTGGAAALPMVLNVLPSTNVRNNFTGWVGVRFTVGASPIVVTSLGRWVMSGNTGTHTVKLVLASSGADVAGGSVSILTSGATAGAFAYRPLAAPVTLAAGTAYFIASQETSGGDTWYDTDTRVETTFAMTVDDGAWSSDSVTWNSGGTYANTSYVPVGALGVVSGSGTGIRITGTYSLSGGTFTSTPSILVAEGDFAVSGTGTFTHNSGTVIMKSATSRTLTCSQAFKNLVFSDGLVAHWRFEDTASPSLDVSGWGHGAAWTNPPTPTTTVKPTLACDNGRALTFDGAGNYLTVGDGYEFQPSTALSIACWLYIPSGFAMIDEGGIFGRDGNGVRGWRIQTSFVEGQITMRNNTTLDVGSNIRVNGLSRDAWHHVAFTNDGAVWNAYLDGVLNSTANLGAATIINPPDGIIWIGRLPQYRGNYSPRYRGTLDDLRFYDRALTAAEVARLAAGREPATTVATFTLGSALTVAGNLTIGSGTLGLNTRAVSVAGNWRCEGVVSAGSSTVTFSGPGATSNTILSGNQSLANVVVAGTATWSCSDAFRASGTFTQSATTFAGNARPLTIGGDMAFNGGTFQSTTDILRCGGGFTDAGGGLFVANPGVVELTTTAAKTLNLADSLNHLWIASGADSGMVARFRLDEAHGANAIDDVAGMVAAYAGTPTATPSATTAAPLVAQNPYCLDFTGATSGTDMDYVTLPLGTALDTIQDNDYSISAWFKPRSVPPGTGSQNNAYYGIVIKKGFHIGLVYDYTGAFGMGHRDTLGNNCGAGSVSTFAAGSWYHLVGTMSRTTGTTSIYVNGILAGTSSWTPSATWTGNNYDTSPWRIGIADPALVVDNWMWPADGWIDDVRFYNRVLSPGEVSALAAGGIDAANGGATISLGGPLDVNGDLALVAGTLSAGANPITAAASWRNYLGNSAFNGGSGTVTLDGAGSQQLYGSTTFNAFTKTTAGATLTFPANECQTFAGTLTLQGTGSGASLMNIRSSISGVQAALKPVGATRVINYLSVQDSRNFVLPLLAPRATTTCVDGGNTRWWFGGTLGGDGVLVGAPGLD